MRKIIGSKYEIEGKLSETNKIIKSSNMPFVELGQSKRGKIIIFDNFRYTINKNSDFNLFRMFPRMWRENGRKWFANKLRNTLVNTTMGRNSKN